jgi:hypothetical protein
MGRRPAIQGRFVFGAGSEVSGGTLRARTEAAGLLSIGGKLLASTQRFSPRHGLGVARARVEDHLPQPGFERVAPLFGQNGEVAQGDVPVDALVDAVELVGTLQGQDPPPAGFGLDRPGGPKDIRNCFLACLETTLRPHGRPKKQYDGSRHLSYLCTFPA